MVENAMEKDDVGEREGAARSLNRIVTYGFS